MGSGQPGKLVTARCNTNTLPIGRHFTEERVCHNNGVLESGKANYKYIQIDHFVPWERVRIRNSEYPDF